MAEPVWGELNKAQDNTQKIEQRIAEMIATHEADPEAHMGAGESIENHRQNDVIDHPASSVFADKLAYDRNFCSLNFENFDLYDHSSGVTYSAINTLYMYCSNNSNPEWFYAGVQDMWSGDEFLYSKNPRFLIKFKVSEIDAIDFKIIIGSVDSKVGFGIELHNEEIYGIYYDSNSDKQSQFLMNISPYTIYKLECRVVDGVNLEFYINNNLIGIIQNANFPTTNNQGYCLPWIDFTSNDQGSCELFVRDFYWEADI